jgi:hypothetical protein
MILENGKGWTPFAGMNEIGFEKRLQMGGNICAGCIPDEFKMGRGGFEGNSLCRIQACLATDNFVDGNVNFVRTALVLGKHLPGMEHDNVLVGVQRFDQDSEQELRDDEENWGYLGSGSFHDKVTSNIAL